MEEVALKMSRALRAQWHPIVYHFWHCGWADVWEWAAGEGADRWRTGQDISDDFS